MCTILKDLKLLSKYLIDIWWKINNIFNKQWYFMTLKFSVNC